MSLRHTAILAALLGAPTPAVAGDAFDRVMLASEDFAIDLVAAGILPDGWPIGRQSHRYLYVNRGGFVTLGTPLGDAVAPGPLAAPDLPIVAPLWVDAAPADCHPGGALNAVSRSRGADGLTIRWEELVAGCATDAARASFEMTVGPSGDGLRVTFRFDELRWQAPGLRAYAGLALGPEAEQQLALFPDPAADAGKLGELLVARSSDGAPGVWVIEVDGEGRVVGDSDRDGVRGIDNCDETYNPLQADYDGDRAGDACDHDDDDDFAPDLVDNCPLKPNDQADWDGDGLGDACDWDDDRDSVPDTLDNCRLAPNKSQTDIDRDGIGDACDPDPDGDGLVGEADRCPWAFDPHGGDLDRDGISDACDLQPKASCGRLCRAEHLDSDGDGVGDLLDRCPLAPDTAQDDRDGDGRGDACDADMDGDGVLDVLQRGCVGGICPDWSRPATVDFIDFWWLDGE